MQRARTPSTSGPGFSIPPVTAPGWTEIDVLTLRQADRDAVGLADVALMLGRTLDAIKGKRRKLGLWRVRGRRSKLFSGVMDEIVTSMKQAGASHRQIGKVVGRTTNQVYERCRALGLLHLPVAAPVLVRKKHPVRATLARFDIRNFEKKRG